MDALQQLDVWLERWRHDLTAPTYKELTELRGLVESMTQTSVGRAARIAAITSDFQNFHRLLCERFGYGHDERDWRRDLLSLIEHIAKHAGGRALADEIRGWALEGLRKPFATDKATFQVRDALVGIWERAEEFITGKPAVLPRQLEGDPAALASGMPPHSDTEKGMAREDAERLRHTAEKIVSVALVCDLLHDVAKKLELGWYAAPPGVATLHIDATAAEIDAAVRAKLIELGWKPPGLNEKVWGVSAWCQTYPRMDIYAKPGTLVMFDARGGYESEQEAAKKVLKLRGVYEVEETIVHSYSSTVKLRGHEGRFNTVMFAQAPELDVYRGAGGDLHVAGSPDADPIIERERTAGVKTVDGGQQ